MNTIEEFQNAPIGATATAPDGGIAFKTGRPAFEWKMFDAYWNHCENRRSDEMGGFTLNPTAPTTSREALDLAWELAHPVKEGQFIPEGTECLARFDDGYRSYETVGELITSETWTDTRTLDRLPRPVPDWLDAPAVLAAMDDCSWQKVWLPSTPGHWECTCCGVDRHWSKMADVTPLYPKDNK